MTGFSIEWLNLREQPDLRARSVELLDLALTFLETGASVSSRPRVLDLGAGTGATLRAVVRRSEALGKSLNWCLVDNDAQSLEEASRRHGIDCHLELLNQDLSDISRLPFAGVTLVTASALLDLVSADFIDRLVASLAEQPGVGLYIALTYDGAMQWTPPHPLDEQVTAVINRDQKEDKGFGLALGPDASSYAETLLEHHGFRVETRPSPWRLRGDDVEMVKEFVTGIGSTVLRESRLDPEVVEEWIQFRHAHASDGHCVVGHVDLLALPCAST